MIWLVLLSCAAKVLDGAMITLGACMVLRIFGVI
jgi:hypothetical protein